ncbi:hypothetical protein E2C01_024198 [Portunus trituberculatus]|uniref:Uncharacterized protein n=1 Tax=Portunus trituberculatus TaxID=210409 RepID=A0A5B7ECI3_PORTR|nr:hypothetical protein [Portunus trituberculatus]
MCSDLCGLRVGSYLCSSRRVAEVREPPRADSLLALQRILGLLDPRFVQQEAPSEQLQQLQKLMWEIEIVKTVAINLVTSIDPS